MSEKLPASWALSELQDVTKISPKFDGVDLHDTELVHFVSMAAVAENFGGADVSQFRPLNEVRKGYTFFAEGDVLFAKITPCMENGKGALVPHLDRTYAFGSTEFHVLRPSKAISGKWLAYFVSQPSFRKTARHNMTGTAGQLRVPTKWLQAVRLPIPPLAEQARIVAKLEELLSDLDAGVAELKAAQKKLQQYRQSLLKATVEGRDGAPYHCHPLGTLVKEIGQGWSPKCDNEPASNEAQWAVIKTTAIQPLSFDDAHNKRLPPTLKPRPHLELRAGDLLVTRAGPRSRVGITCLVRQTRMKLILCDKAYRIRCDELQINPSFLELVLNAPHFVQQIDALKTGINDSGLNLTQDRFFTLMIPVPELREQERLVEQINTLNMAIQEQEKNIELSLKQSAAQRQNILRAAFAGQLVSQDPNDEPASVLLERIRSERAAHVATKKPRGRKTEEAAA